MAVVLAAGIAAVEPAGATTLRWHGQACFEVVSDGGARVLIDPFSAGMGYDVPEVAADLVLISHEHGDHNNTGAARGEPVVLHGLQMDDKPREVRGVVVRAVRTDHDAAGGAQRGRNTLFVLKMDGMAFVLCGDLGHALSPEQVKAVGRVDVLMVPVGGYYTIDGPTAARVVQQLKPRLVIPMHYKTAATPKSPISGPEAFLEAARAAGWPVETLGPVAAQGSAAVQMTRRTLPKRTKAMVLTGRLGLRQ